MKRLVISFLCFVAASVIFAQQDNENEFQRIAQRIMDSHETGNVLLADSLVRLGAWHGGYYLGAASNGRTLPSASMSYKRGDLTITGNLALDILDKNQEKTDETFGHDGSARTVLTNILTNSKNVDGNIQFDYDLGRSDHFMLSLIEQYKKQMREEEAYGLYYDEEREMMATSISAQENRLHNLTLGTQAQWKHTFADQSLLLMRASLKHKGQGIDADFTDWSREGVPTLDEAGLTLKGNAPLGEVHYNSAQWGGFGFELGSRYAFEKVGIDNDDTDFAYRTENRNYLFGMKYDYRQVRLSASASYNDYRQKVDSEEQQYRNLLPALRADWTISTHHDLLLTYNSSIKCPSYLQLYPYRYLESSLGTYYLGNASLDPARVNELKVVYTYDNLPTLKVSVTTGYERIQDDITEVAVEAKTAVGTYKTWSNDALYNNFHMAIDGQWQWGILDLRWHIRPRYTSYRAVHESDYGKWSWNFKLRPELTLPGGWKTACALYYQGAEHKLTTYVDAYTYFSVRAVKDFGNWSIYAFYQDIFEQDRVETVYGSTSQVTTRKDMNDEALIVGFSYTF